MTKLIKYFKTVRKDLLSLLVIAFTNYLLIELWLNEVQEIFPNASKLGQLSSKLSIAYISGFIFYFIVVHIKSENDKENINEFVGHKVHNILTDSSLFFQDFIDKNNKTVSFEEMSFEERSKLLYSINRYSNDSPLLIDGENANWIKWWDYLKDSIFESLREIYLRYNHLDSELIKLLTRIEESLFFKQWIIIQTDQSDKTFGLYDLQVDMFINLTSDLKKYADKNFKEFRNRSSEFLGYKNIF